MAPLVVMPVVGLLWLWVAPVAMVVPLLLVLVLNAAGAVGALDPPGVRNPQAAIANRFRTGFVYQPPGF